MSSSWQCYLRPVETCGFSTWLCPQFLPKYCHLRLAKSALFFSFYRRIQPILLKGKHIRSKLSKNDKSGGHQRSGSYKHNTLIRTRDRDSRWLINNPKETTLLECIHVHSLVSYELWDNLRRECEMFCKSAVHWQRQRWKKKLLHVIIFHSRENISPAENTSSWIPFRCPWFINLYSASKELNADNFGIDLCMAEKILKAVERRVNEARRH